MIKKLLFLFCLVTSFVGFSQCNYSFVLRDTGANGWSGNTMSVLQNNVVVSTFGSTFTSGSGPITIQVPLTDGVPFQLRWNAGGTSPGQVSVSILNPFGETLYTKAGGTGSQNSILYTGNVSCAQCVRPTTVSVSDIGQTSATVSWDNTTGATQWEVIVLRSNVAAPAANQQGAISADTNFLATGLACGLSYTAYVKTVCSETNASIWRASTSFVANACNQETCADSNSLCGSFGVPFQNSATLGTPSSGGAFGCLSTTFNIKLFHFSVNAVGSANIEIEQNTSFDSNGNPTGTGLDADYALFGPYSQPITDCVQELTADRIISCSYSPNYFENFTLNATQPGAYYYLMVTNYSNNPGFIKISQLSGDPIFDCTGFKLNAFLDTNSNGIKDVGEQSFTYGQFQYQKNNTGAIHNVVSSNAVLDIEDGDSANTYDFSFLLDSEYSSYYSLSTASYNDISLAGSGITTVNFPVVATNLYHDVEVALVSNGEARPGFTYSNKIIYSNKGNQIVNGTINFVKDNVVTITNISQTGTVATPNGFTYDFVDLQPFETRTFNVNMQVPTIPTVELGDLLTNSASISILPNVDVIAGNNNSELIEEVIGSYDPNDIMEAHGEEILHATFASDEYLYYTIRFENTGSASAINVKVNTILDSKLDETTLKMIGSSHNFVLDRVGSDLNWDFKNIMLPATIQNPSASKGYIVYRIKPKPGYAIGDIIPSTASIYFDFNPAIITNTFNTEFVAQLGVNEFETNTMSIYPNPVKDNVTIAVKNGQEGIASITVYDIYGKMVFSKSKIENRLTEKIDLSRLSNGMYLLEVITESNHKTIKKLLVE